MHATSLLMNNGDHVYDATDGIAISAKKLKKMFVPENFV